MANRDDLRFIKTERTIEETYIALKKKTRSPVKVSELCEAALINKSTFYAHYETIEALGEHVCGKAVEAILADCPAVDAAFTDTTAFVCSLVDAIRKNEHTLDILFDGDPTRQINMFEEQLLRRYLDCGESPQMEMKIVFAIGGAARLLLTGQSPERIKMTIRLIEAIFHSCEGGR